jgi:subtilisin family serine protease
MRRHLIFLIVAVLAWGRQGLLVAGEVSPDLAARASLSDAGEKIPVIISMAHPISAATLKAELSSDYKTRAARHQVGLDRLKREASVSQASVLARLRQMENAGLASDVRSHWIVDVVSAKIAASEIENIASRTDVSLVFELPEITLIEPVESGTESADFIPGDVTGIEPNITAVGADSAWTLGYTGEGRVVCSFDTGVEGLHPSLFDKWKGHDGDSAAAWFDPVGNEPFPHIFSNISAPEHGTHVMGIMVGQDDDALLNKDYIGVAPGAKWISAAVINILGASIIDAFEWAADPDGDPNTIDDVPDVINHSWGIFDSAIGCHDYFWDMIDNTEALGIVNIFAAGNEGSEPMSIRNPANRAVDSLNSFAVGAVDTTFESVFASSSRGPSICNPGSQEMIKPNIIAPGEKIWSSVPSTYIRSRTGTSMAAPHVSGAVAILRQYAPDATVNEIKEALLAGCRATSASGELPNNDFGWGFLDIPASLEALTPPPEPDLRVYSFEHPDLNPGDMLEAFVLVKNFGDPVSAVFGFATCPGAALTILTDTLDFGFVARDSVVSSAVPFQALISDTVTAGRMLAVDFDIYGDGGYHCPCHLYVRVGESPHAGFYTHRNDILQFTVSNFGHYGFGYGSFYPLGYDGFKYIDTFRNDLYEGALMIGVDSDHVSDGARNLVEEPDNDFAVSLGGDLQVFTPGANADQETLSKFNDGRAEHSIGMEIEQRTLSWDDPPDNNFVILEYIIENATDSLINGVYIGLFFDWDLHNGRIDGGGYEAYMNLGYVYHPGLLNTEAKYRGICLVSHGQVAAHRLIRDDDDVKDLAKEESEKYLALSEGRFDLDTLLEYDLIQVFSVGPIDLQPGQLDTIALAVVAADSSLENLTATAVRAKIRYNATTDIEISEDDILPGQFTLNQNYPNPFNPVTTISFALYRRSRVEVAIYNLLGEIVAVPIRSELPAGLHEITWDGRDRHGLEVASGVYFYRLRAGNSAQVRKMVLLK